MRYCGVSIHWHACRALGGHGCSAVLAPPALTMTGAKAAAAMLLLACALQRCAAQLPGMLPMPPACTGALNGPAPRSDLSWPANETKLSEGLRQADRGKVTLLL